MEKRQIRMEDGRYLIFYTFEDSDQLSEGELGKPEPESQRPEGGDPESHPQQY